MNAGLPAWFDVNAAAAHVVVSPATILRAARSGHLRGYKVSGRKCWRFRPADVDAWLMAAVTPVLVENTRRGAA